MKNHRPPSQASPQKQFYFLTLSHTVLDSYATLLSHLQPRLLEKLASAANRNSLAGNFVSIYSLFSSFGQILFGWLSDRVRTVHFVTFGVALTAIGLSLLWVAPTINSVYLLLAIGGHWYCCLPPTGDGLRGCACQRQRDRDLYFSQRVVTLDVPLVRSH